MFWSLALLLLQRQPEKGRAIFQFQGAVQYGREVMTGRAEAADPSHLHRKRTGRKVHAQLASPLCDPG